MYIEAVTIVWCTSHINHIQAKYFYNESICIDGIITKNLDNTSNC